MTSRPSPSTANVSNTPMRPLNRRSWQNSQGIGCPFGSRSGSVRAWNSSLTRLGSRFSFRSTLDRVNVLEERVVRPNHGIHQAGQPLALGGADKHEPRLVLH